MGGLKGQGLFEQIYSLENLRIAFENFRYGKTKKPDVIAFSKNAKKELYSIYDHLRRKSYKHGSYETFYIQDPKLRKINKATARDRVLHHAVFRKIYPIFDQAFIFDSYSCRVGKGTHRGVKRLQEFFKKESKNNSRLCWVLKCDIKKFFDNIDHEILLRLVARRIKDENVLWLVDIIINSFKKGLPLGNITSQVFANIYLHELDLFIKHHLKAKYYIRYCDDFVILNVDKKYLGNLVVKINDFLIGNLKMSLHPNKISISNYRQGIDFLGYVSFPYHTILRPKTKKRMFRKIGLKLLSLEKGSLNKDSFKQTMQSYLGMLKHCNSVKIKGLLWKTLDKVIEIK